MNKKSILGLILIACLITTGLFFGATYMMRLESVSLQEGQIPSPILEEDKAEGQEISGQAVDDDHASIDEAKVADEAAGTDEAASKENAANTGKAYATAGDGSQAQARNTSDAVHAAASGNSEALISEKEISDQVGHTLTDPTEIASPESELTANPSDPELALADHANETFSTSLGTVAAPQLILDSTKVDYMSYIPEMVVDSQLTAALDISNPSISVDAKAAILFDAKTKQVLYHKDAVIPIFPASTAKLLTSLAALKRCQLEEQVTVGEEKAMIASDSTTAGLKEGEILTIKQLLTAMLLPSGNDAAYVVAGYVGRKSLGKPNASREEAVAEFIRLMNQDAEELGVKNSCFKTPDGYDAIGQYTTAYDMGLIGIAASENETIIEICQKGSSRNVLVSGEDITWNNTNKLVRKYSGQYFSHAIGLKTGTSTMAGKCLIAAAEDGDKKVVCVIMDSSSSGRWEDAIALLKYGLNE